jgi:glycosyltransferase involved in cell wall biosynthesis
MRRSRELVLHVIPHLWSGAGAVVTRLCEAQREMGRPVAIVTSGSRGSQPDWPAYRARLRRAGVTHHTIDFYHRESDRFWSSAAELAELLRTLRPAVIHAHAGVPCGGAVVARALSGHRARIVGQMYSWGPGRPAWMNVQDMWGFGQADRVICSARAYWDLLVGAGVSRRKLVYLPWGLPLDRLPWRGDVMGGRSRTMAGRPAGASPIIGFVGRIEPRKGQLTLVEAFARVRRRHPAARLELVGPVADEPYGDRLRSAIATHGLDAAVHLTGEVRDVTRYVRRWDLFVSLSADEGQGLAVLEAMALGVPVVARPVAGISDFLVDGRTGIAIAEDGSAPRAAEAIDRALQPSSRLEAIGRRARRMVERRYDWEQTLTAFERLYGHRRT